MFVLQRGHIGDGCDLASTLCKYDLRKGDLFVLSLAGVRRVRWGNISSALLLYGGGVHSILLLPLVARCLETIDVCIWHMFVFMPVVVIVWGSVGMYECFVIQMFVSCVHPVAVLNAAFCMICSLLMLVKDARGDYMEEAYSRACLMTAL